MRASVFVVVAMSFALPCMVASTLVASADEGSPTPSGRVDPRVRPPSGVLRHVDAPTASPAPATAHRAKELVVLVGGYQSCACPDDGTFDPLRARLEAIPDIDVVRFGADPRFPYDTFGAIEPSALNLRDQIRAVADQYTAVHIVTHSMGGVVADRAFADGLSRDDGVVTYVSWSAPHDGSDAARGLEIARLVTGAGDGAFREGLLWLQMESNSPAVRDLARVRAAAPPDGVVRLDLREASDVLVTARDARDPGVPSRTLTGAAEGHGGILTDPQALDLTMRTIETRRVPPDDRARALRAAADAESARVGDLVILAVCALALTACVAGILGHNTLVSRVAVGLKEFVPRAARKPCP
jgi:PGAP1-like protein